MERIITDVKVYANCLIDEMIRIKDRHRDVLTGTEIDSINGYREPCEPQCKGVEEAMKEKYLVATGSITGSFITVERYTVPVYPDYDGGFWYRNEDGEIVRVED